MKADGSLLVWEGVEENSEQLWVTYENREEKHAFCGVYLAVKHYKNKKPEELNAEILIYYKLKNSFSVLSLLHIKIWCIMEKPSILWQKHQKLEMNAT